MECWSLADRLRKYGFNYDAVKFGAKFSYIIILTFAVASEIGFWTFLNKT